jgi:hypothetical protein
MDRLDIFRTLKECVTMSGYKPPFVPRQSKRKSKMVDVLKFKYPYLKKEELFMMVDFIDDSEDKDSIYEMFGFYKPKKKKTTKADKAKMKKIQDEQLGIGDLMGNFK